MTDGILVVKIKHHADLTEELKKAVLVANYAIKNRSKLSSTNVSHIGLPSAISNQVLRKYGKNKKLCYFHGPEGLILELAQYN